MIEQNGSGLRVSGPMLIADAPALLAAGRGFLRGLSGSDVLVDLAGVAEADSSALGVIFALQRSAHERGAALRIVNPPAGLMSLAGLYGVAETLPLA